MKFSDEGYIINCKKHGEKSLILTVLCKNNGKVCGYVKSGLSKKNLATFQLGNLVKIVLDNTKTEKQNLKELEKFAYDFEQKVRSGKYLSGEKLSFQEFTEIWFKDYGNIHLEKKTRIIYEQLLQKHILPVIGHLKLSKILPIHCFNK